jgi:hypothetical protein
LEELKDIHESELAERDRRMLDLLLCDKTTGARIKWATSGYASYGRGYNPTDEITPERITGDFEGIIRPRFDKPLDDQVKRTRDNAEVFTPSWVCCAQNNKVDEAWFGHEGAICSNANPTTGWDVNPERIEFEGRQTWQRYVDKRVLEVSCGEAPYLVSRYDVATGETIPVERRMGLLDRKLRVVCENTENSDELFEKWVVRAYEATYGFDLQGDNVLLARENLLATLDEWLLWRRGEPAEPRLRHKVANRVAWNVFQMDGISLSVPYATRPAPQRTLEIFADQQPTEPLPVKVRDWRDCTGGTAIEFKRLVKEVR